uniref:GRF-type domain-containing protein n=1 Tax=Lactuca sativa TaxID=4236 RepID=A0A9R1XQX5_LACSA|nr:hypothetical protein LSAT_V11C200099720 [Lactuca sativa]
MWHLRGLYVAILITYVALRSVYIIRRVRYDCLLIKTLDRSMTSSSSSFSSKRQDELKLDHPCDCDLPSRVKTSRTTDNPRRKFKVCQNSLNGKSPSCKFWQWLDEDEWRKDGRRHYRMKPEESCNFTLKICTLENEISICRMKIEQEKNKNKEELDKVNWKLFTHRLALIFLFLLYVKMLF